jgi:hypothetical protein
MTRRGALGTGLALVAVYVAAAALTVGLGGRHVRPLFEGVGPSAPYDWVKPPPEFAAGNVRPKPGGGVVALTPTGSQAGGVSTDDGQFLLNLPQAAFAPRAGDDSLTISLTPLDPAGLGKLPPDLRPDGNAYRVQVEYSPSHVQVAAVDKPGNVVIRMPEPFHALLHSADGQTWEPLPASQVGTGSTAGATFAQLGYYLGAAQASTAPPQGKGSGSIGGVLVIATVTIMLALGLVLGPVAVRRLRRRPATPPPRPPSGARPQPRRTGAKRNKRRRR